MTIAHRLRIRNVHLTWCSFTAASAWPVTFVGLITILGVYANNTATAVPSWVFAGYVFGGLVWFLASVLGTSTMVSRHGLVRGFGRQESAAAWIQITDYFEVLRRRRTHFVFFYLGPDGTRKRIEVSVPATHLAQFRTLVNEQLSTSTTLQADISQGRRATS